MSVGQRGTQELDPLLESFFEKSFVGFTGSSEVTYDYGGELFHGAKRFVAGKERKFLEVGQLEAGESLEGIVLESGAGRALEEVLVDLKGGKAEIELSRELHALVVELIEVDTKFKTVAQKVRPAAIQLLENAKEVLERASKEPRLRLVEKIEHKFTKETLLKLRIGTDGLLNEKEKETFGQTISEHGRAFSFTIEEVGCADPKFVTPMVVFIVPHVPWDLKPIVVP
ncbi:unnamed protein product [Calypogeia fissa]